MFVMEGELKMEIPKEIYEIIDYIRELKHPEETLDLLIAFTERGIEQGNDGFESSDLLGGEGFAFADIT